VEPHLERLQREIASAIASAPKEQLNSHPPGKWSMAEILEHLYLTYTGTTKGFGRVLDAGQPQVTTATLKQRGRSLVVLGMGYLPSGRESPPFARPRGLEPEAVTAQIGAKIAEMDAIMQSCESKFGRSAKVLDHAILGPLTVAQWRKFHLVHGLHHLKQIRGLQRA
jgi:hypothetical protein